MSTHILCAVDLTHMDEAKALLREAAQQASKDDAALSLVTVLPDYGMSFVGSFFKDGTLKEAAAAALDALHALADDVTDQQVQCIVEIGSVYEKTLEAADLCHADLIVVGAHKPNLSSQLLGPNAARIVRHAKVSVLVSKLPH